MILRADLKKKLLVILAQLLILKFSFMLKLFRTVIVIIFTTTTLLSQAPQSICYQAVATDQAGRELINQNVKVRVSILKSSASGTEEWVETHTLSTDGFGLFDFQIGNGTRTSGAQTQFGNIRWGQDKHFLKVEMDVTGGNNFVLMGTNQMVSVPYALYTERAYSAIVADSSGKAGTANSALTAQTATFATKAGFADLADKANKADFATKATFADSSAKANQAMRAIYADSSKSSYSAFIAQKATNSIYADSAKSSYSAFIAQKAFKSDSSTFSWYADSSRRAGQAQRAILADSSLRSQIAWNAINANKAILADSATKSGLATRAIKADTALVAKTAVDDFDRDPKNELQTLTYRNDTLVLSNPLGSPSAIAMASGPFRAPGASIEYPQGIFGESMAITTGYTVPVGKSFFISAVNNGVILGDNRTLFAEPGMPIIPSGYRISECYCTGILVPEQEDIKPLILDFSSPIFEYTVPTGYTLIIKSGKTARGLLDLQIDSDIFNFYTVTSQSPRLIVINAGKKVKKPITILPSDAMVLTGYLLKNR